MTHGTGQRYRGLNHRDPSNLEPGAREISDQFRHGESFRVVAGMGSVYEQVSFPLGLGMSGTADRALMAVDGGGVRRDLDQLEREMVDAQGAAKHRAVEPLRIAVPTSGIHFAFE